MPSGQFAFVLHSHLPYVISHGKWPHGTDWLNEAAAETYLPILGTLRELIDEGYHPRLTVGLSPVLCEQLADESFKREFEEYCAQKIDAAEQDKEEFRRHGRAQMLSVAESWIEFYSQTIDHFRRISRDILGQFRSLQDNGYLEIITCGATHGYLPLLARDESVQCQIKLAIANYRRHFGQSPRGIWLPECAYRPRYAWSRPIGQAGSAVMRKGVDEFLSENGLDFFIVDSVLLKGGKSTGVYIERFEALKLLWHQFESQYSQRTEEPDKSPREVYLVASSPEGKKPTAIFARDPQTGILVWSGEHGYPGDGNYLDFHKKHFPGGHRYWAVTSSKADLADKVEYNPKNASGRISENAAHFVSRVEEILDESTVSHAGPSILVAPYDAELFGHWWFEGPRFLKEVLKGVEKSDSVELAFLGEHYDQARPSQVVSIPEGSWGQGNHHYIWLNEQTEWTWKHIYESEDTMCALARFWVDNPDRQDAELTAVLKQLARELLLMSASDWQFLISTFAARDYAELRLSEHYEDFTRLAKMARAYIDGEQISSSDRQFLRDCQDRDNLFEEIDLNWLASVEYPAEPANAT